MLHKDNCKPIREALEFLDLVWLILEILQYVAIGGNELMQKRCNSSTLAME